MSDIEIFAIPEQPDAFDPLLDSVIVTDRTAVAGTGLRKMWELLAPGLVSEAGTTITLAKATHYQRVTKAANAAAITLTIPPGLAAGSAVILQTGAGQITVAAGMGVTLRSGASGGLKSKEQYGPPLTLIWLAANEWLVLGGVA